MPKWLTRRRFVLAGLMGLAILFVATLVPGSPLFVVEWYPDPPTEDGKTAEQWTQELGHPDVDARRAAAKALRLFDPTPEAVERLTATLRDDPDASTRSYAAFSLSRMAPESRSAVPVLAEKLADPDTAVRMHSALALFRLRAEARPAIPALIRAIALPENVTYVEPHLVTIQEQAVLALGRASAGSPEGLATLITTLQDAETNYLRRAAAQALGDIGSEARPAAAMLYELLADDSEDIRVTAEKSLTLIEGSVPEPPKPRSELELPEAELGYLWDVEHHGNLLMKHGFGPFASALKAADTATLTAMLATDFSGGDLHDPVRSRLTGSVEAERLQSSGKPPLPLNRSQFAARLVDLRKVFATEPPGTKFSLIALSPKGRDKLDRPWDVSAQLRLHGESTPGAPAEVVIYLRGEIDPPTKERLANPGWVRSMHITQVQIGKAPKFLYADVTKDRGLRVDQLHDNWASLAYYPTPGGCFVTDYDRDGRLDILVTDANDLRLYRGIADGRFSDVTAQSGLRLQKGSPLAVCWVDLDGDGWDDLILTNRVYRNEQGKRFVDVTERTALRLPADTVSVTVADFDRDGRLDLYATRIGRKRGGMSWLEGRTGDLRGNALYRNLGDWRFEDVTRSAGAAGGFRSTFTAAWLDANNDGWPDLHVPNEFGDGVLLLNQKNGTFAEQKLADRMADFGTMGLAVGDINNDGNIDIYCANMYSKAGTRVIGNLKPDAYPAPIMEKFRRFVAGSQLHLNRGDGTFEQVGTSAGVASVGWAYGPALADLDNDGLLDVFGNAGYVSRNRDEPDG